VEQFERRPFQIFLRNLVYLDDIPSRSQKLYSVQVLSLQVHIYVQFWLRTLRIWCRFLYPPEPVHEPVVLSNTRLDVSMRTRMNASEAGSKPCFFFGSFFILPHATFNFHRDRIVLCLPSSSLKMATYSTATQEITAAVRPVPWDGSFIPLPPHLCQPSQPPDAETVTSFCATDAVLLRSGTKIIENRHREDLPIFDTRFAICCLRNPSSFTRIGTISSSLMNQAATCVPLFQVSR
jgi:hypothetical protein